MPYTGIDDSALPNHIVERPTEQRQRWIAVFNAVYADTQDEGQAFATANDAIKATPEKYSHIDFKPTEAMANAAQAGLDQRKEHGRGGTEVGVARARDISNRVNLSPETVRRMHSFFSRHASNESAEGFDPGEDGYPSAGRIAWNLWGGDPGAAWARARVEQMDAADRETKAVKSTAIKMLDNSRFGGYGVVWGDMRNKDLEGDYFTPDTDFWLEWYNRQPMVYDHAQGALPIKGDMPKRYVFGRVAEIKKDRHGLYFIGEFLSEDEPSVEEWAEDQANKRKQWLNTIKQMMGKGLLNFSSGSVDHLVKRAPDGCIKSWPIVEMTVTPTPAEARYTDVRVLKHLYTSIGAEDAFEELLSRATEARNSADVQSPNKSKSEVKKMNLDIQEAALDGVLNAAWKLHGPAIKSYAVKMGDYEDKMDMVDEDNSKMDEEENEERKSAIKDLLRPIAKQYSEATGMAEEEAMEMLVGAALEKVKEEVTTATEDVVEEVIDEVEEVAPMVPTKAAQEIAKLKRQVKALRSTPTRTPTKNTGAYFGGQAPMAFTRSTKESKAPLVDSINAMMRNDHKAIKALGLSPGAAGGYMVPTEQSNEVIEFLRAESLFLAPTGQSGLVRVIPMTSDVKQIPKQAGGVTTGWIGDNATMTANDPNFGQVQLVSRKLYAFVKLSNSLLEDSDPDIDALIREDMARALGNEIDLVILEGTGVAAEPTGILNTTGVTTNGLDSSVTYANLLTAISTVKSAKVPQDNTWAWVFNPSDEAAIRQLETDGGDPLWISNAGYGQPTAGPTPPNLLGYPVHITPLIENDTDDNDEREIYFGRWSDCLLGMRKSIEIVASNQAGTAFQTDQTWIRAIMRVDVAVRHPESFYVLTDVRDPS